MEKSLSSRYKDIFRKLLFPYGFHLYKKTFYRTTKDVIQTVMLVKTHTDFSIEFNILPLCLPIEDLHCEGYDLANIGKRGAWSCFRWPGEGAFEEIEALFKQYVWPAFERATDAKRGYDERIKIQKMIFTGIPEGIIWHDFASACLCIRAQNYVQAQRHLEAIALLNLGADDFSRFLNSEKSNEDIALYTARFSPKISLRIQTILSLLTWVSSANTEKLDSFIAEQEKISSAFLNAIK